MLGDNMAMHRLVTKEGTTSRSRHFERATIFVKYAIMRLMVACYFVVTTVCVADILTKATDEATFLKLSAVILNSVATDPTSLVDKADRVLRYLVNAFRRG